MHITGVPMDTKKVRLPNKDEMLAILITVDDAQLLQERFYPLLLELAGRELGAQSLAIGIALATGEYMKGMTSGMPIYIMTLRPALVDGILDDKKFAAEVKAYL